MKLVMNCMSIKVHNNAGRLTLFSYCRLVMQLPHDLSSRLYFFNSFYPISIYLKASLLLG